MRLFSQAKKRRKWVWDFEPLLKNASKKYSYPFMTLEWWRDSSILTKNTWIGDSGVSWHITNNEIDGPVQGSKGDINTANKGKPCLKVKQIDGSKIEYTLWPVKYYEIAIANLFSVTCELFQELKMSSDSIMNIVLDNSDDWIVWDQAIKTRDRWVAGVDVICEGSCKNAHVMNQNVSPMKF